MLSNKHILNIKSYKEHTNFKNQQDTPYRLEWLKQNIKKKMVSINSRSHHKLAVRI